MRLFSNMLTFNRVRDGEDGKQGAMLVPEGSWDENKTYLRDQYKTPIVEHEGLFYSLNKEGMTKGGLNPKDDYAKNGSKATWRLQESYEMVIVKALVAGGGLVGEFVFWDGKMMSQQGVDKAGNPSTKYEEFRTGNFIPNLVFDALTGDVIALKGRFGMFYIDGSDIVGKTAGGAEVMRITGKEVPNADLFNGKWVFEDTNSKSEIEDFVFVDDPQGTEDVYRNTFEFSVIANKVGMYSVKEVLFQWRYKTTPEQEIALNELSLTYSVFRGQNKISSGYMENESDLEFYADKTGIYKIEISVYARFNAVRINVDRVYESLVCETGYRALSYKSTPANTTLIGNDGLYTSFSSEEFLHYKAGEGFILRSGNYGLRVSKSGIQKWNGNQWVAANI